jgi:hypothetical protein
MQISIMLDLLDSCDQENELKVAHKLVSAECELVAKRDPAAMKPLEYIACSWAFRYLCHSALNSGINH